MRAHEGLKEPIESWDTILVVIVRDKLFPSIREKWEDITSESMKPTMKEMITFLQRRAQFEDASGFQSGNKQSNSSAKNFSSRVRPNNLSQQTYAISTTKHLCPCCAEEQNIFSCKKFENLSPYKRYEVAKKASLCLNCLRKNHHIDQCPSKQCHICNKKHHTLLHFPNQKPNNRSTKASGGNQSTVSNPSSESSCYQAQISFEALLATAIVDLVNKQGKSKNCRVFLDAGSQAHFITEEAAEFLQLVRESVDISVTGLHDSSTKIIHAVTANIKSLFNKFEKSIELLVVPSISKAMPSTPINLALLEIPKNISLDDPDFHRPSSVDLLIGVKLFYKLLCVGQIALKNHPGAILQKTQLGWIIAGEINRFPPSDRNIQCHFSVFANSSDTNLTRFWEIEEISAPKALSSEETACEVHFKYNTQRTPEVENAPEVAFYLPHHAVVKEDSLTTKIRVVFDGSAKTSSGVSLNDTLMVGSKIQDDLFDLLSRFRSHLFVLTADIEKMYSQVLVHPDDTIFQKILFRSTVQEPIKEYTLDTVTYGTACASFLAIRALHQLADDEGTRRPIAAAIVKRDFYVDDLLTGANTHQEAAFLRDDLLKLLKNGGFNLRKWASNDPNLVSEYPENPDSTHMSLDPGAAVKTLGIQWSSREDTLFYSLKTSDSSKKAGVDWDESIPSHIYTSWLEYKNQLPLLSNLKFDRHITVPQAVEIQMHGYCDASEQAYGAFIYLRSIDAQGNIYIQLVCSKSRVAPVTPLTLPRLELCSAVLLARLYAATRQALDIDISKVNLWSDSTIALHWSNIEPHLLKTFVSNRVAKIQKLTQSCHWRHVSSQNNPADLVSRGQTAREFIDSTILGKMVPLGYLMMNNSGPRKKIF
ncbi:uncharacterized protein LOC117180818 [Belonocnema kinseyi]|uniref:uncharacterized protein LOC117180818 n=1 Tax=Belonocnema kinseyi TaxID=2817044 RepID=UPI00143DACF1|nr:uncharacterized protein LOC117180818 [Belonocnema kinseyi]